MAEGLRLFLIEDDDDVALLIRKSLERVAHHVTRCRSGADALIVLGHTSFDLVLLDQRLPDMSGLDLLQTLAHEGITAPVLMVTGYGDEHLATRVLRAGALDYIVKDPALTFLGELPKRVSESVKRYRLEQTNRLQQQALESTRDGIIITDVQGTILEVNHAVEALTGYTREEMIGQTPRLFKSGIHAAEVFSGLWQTILNRGSWQGELTNRRKDGTLFQCSITISPIVDPQGRLTHFVGIMRDMTTQKQLERQLLQAQKMQSVGTLAGGVAHEFNNLLAGINGYAALALREPGISTNLQEFLRKVVTLSERAATLTRQLLAFARKPALTRSPMDAAELVRGTAELVGQTLRLDVCVEVQAAGQGDASDLWIEGDANQLQQALVNLILNARDAVDSQTAAAGAPPAPAICCRASRAVLDRPRFAFPQQVPPGDYVLLEVADHGCGMSTDVLNQSLDPFFTTKDVGQGTGLGLPMVFGIVQGHQGYLKLDSTPGKGTCVGLYLPHLPRRPAGRPAMRWTDTEVVEPETTPGRSILVIDDEEAVLDVIGRFLQIAGHQVACVTSGAAALDFLAEGWPVDLIILDVMMPQEDVTEVLPRLKRCRPQVPVLLCTGIPPADPALSDIHHAVAGLIRKPFRMNELWYAVNQALLG
jgi:PAS domain S-box-containing protein